MSDKNIDSLLAKVAASAIPDSPAPVAEEEAPQDPVENEVESEPEAEENPESPAPESEPESEEAEPNPEREMKDHEAKADSLIDEYGNPVDKPKLYTDEEVQRMIRERLARGKQADPAKQIAQDFTPDPESNEPWEAQLETFIDRTLEKRERANQQKAWQAKEAEIQHEFESKFNSGMGKYADFTQVVQGKPITDAMMLATRSMKDPAAFIYAASKTQSVELERIAKLQDPYQQATEIGRLEERMKKTRALNSKAGKPLTPIKGDVQASPKRNIDELIRIDEKRKLRR